LYMRVHTVQVHALTAITVAIAAALAIAVAMMKSLIMGSHSLKKTYREEPCA
jgi:hypothetical protein